MTTQPKDLMTLEDVVKGIETLRLHECGSSNRAVADLYDATLHHLKAGRKALDLANDAMNTCVDHCLENGHIFSQTYNSTRMGTAHIAVRSALRASAPTAQEVKEGPC